MSETLKTKSGGNMKPAIKNKIVEVMTNPANDGVAQAGIAEKVGVSVRTLRNYLTDELWDKIRTLRLDVMSNALADVDRAVFAKAIKGDISAAKIIYSRWEQLQAEDESTVHDPETLEDIEQEIATIKKEILMLEEGS